MVYNRFERSTFSSLRLCRRYLTIPFPCSNPPYYLSIRIRFTGLKGSRLRVWLDGSELFDTVIGSGEWNGTFEVERKSIQELAFIELSSDTLVPREVKEGSIDGRTLGIALYAIGLFAKE